MAFSKYIFFNNTINTDSAIINYVAEFLSCLQFFLNSEEMSVVKIDKLFSFS